MVVCPYHYPHLQKDEIERQSEEMLRDFYHISVKLKRKNTRIGDQHLIY